MDANLPPDTVVKKVPMTDLDIPLEDLAKVLFLSTNPVHNQHSTGGVEDECSMCRLLMKFGDAINKKNFRVLKQELKKKIAKLRQVEVPQNQEFSTLESNFSNENDELTLEDEELLVFCETLDMMQIQIPEDLKTKFETVLTVKRIPARKTAPNKKGNSTIKEEKNNFLAYTTNKILSEISEDLTAEDVIALKNFILKQDDNDDSMVNLQASLESLNDITEHPEYKDVLFYFIVINMRKLSILNRLHTHMLEFFLTGCKELIPNPEKKKPIELAVEKLSRYPMTVNPPGICIIVAMTKDRDGAEDDLKNVRKVFEEDLNYNVLVRINPTLKKLKDLVSELDANRYQFYDSLVVWFMGHGTKSYLQINGGEIHRRNEFIQPFAEIEWLRKKPKLFFIQACAVLRKTRPSQSEYTLGLPTETDSMKMGITSDKGWNDKYGAYTDGYMVNSLADTLISYATLWHEKASRDEKGSLFIHTLMTSLKEHGKTKSIEMVLRDTHYKVNTVSLNSNCISWKQTPYYESSLQKEFVFP